MSKFEAVTKSENNGPAWADAADGVYTASVDGLHDKIEVSITVAGGKIENIEITGGRDSMLITDEQLAEYVARSSPARALMWISSPARRWTAGDRHGHRPGVCQVNKRI